MTMDMANTEVLQISTLGFTLLTFKALETNQQVWTQEDLLSKEDQVWEHLTKQVSTSPWDVLGYISEW